MKSRGKNINLFLIDGNVNGRVKCTLANWTGIAFKIPRTELVNCGDRPELNQSGVYFLFGVSDETGQPIVYVGQAGIRKNGKGLLLRLSEHDHNPNEDYWTEAIALTTANDTLGPTELNYLENRFYNLAVDANRYIVKNANDPNQGNVSEEKQCELEDFIDYAKIVIGTLGHKVLEPIDTEGKEDNSDTLKFYCKIADSDAVGIRTADGFVVKKGSKISSQPKPACPNSALRRREEFSSKIDANFILLEDILFSTPSGASSFVRAAASAGNDDWKTEDGKKLKTVIAQMNAQLNNNSKN